MSNLTQDKGPGAFAGDRRDFLRVAAGMVALPIAVPAPAMAEAQYTPDSKMMGAAKFIDVDGIRTRYFDGGRGQPLVLIHGGNWPATTSAYDFAPVFDRLAAHFHVYTFDKLGMGFTDNPKDDADFTMAGVVRHGEGFIRALGLKNFIIGGHSRGGLPAARIACDMAENVSHLVLFDSNTLAPDDPNTPERIDPPIIETPPTLEQIRGQQMKSAQIVQKYFLTDAWFKEEWTIARLPKIKEADARFRAARDKWVAAHPDIVAQHPLWKRNLGATTWWTYETKYQTLDMIKAGKLKAPTIIIWGFDDPTAPFKLGVDMMETISKVVERSELHILNRAGHFVYNEHADRVTQLITDFVGV